MSQGPDISQEPRFTSLIQRGDRSQRSPSNFILLGLYADKETSVDKPFGEQTRMFEDLTRYGSTRGVKVVVLTPGYSRTGTGWNFHLSTKRWIRQSTPLPNVVLRRSGTFRSKEASSVGSDMNLFAKTKRLHSLPRVCSNKWHLYQLLRKVPSLRSRLPESAVAEGPRQVFEFLTRHRDVYVKPLAGAQGVNVYRFQVTDSGVVVRWEERKVPRQADRVGSKFNPQTDIQTRTLLTYIQFERFWTKTGLRRCIVQETIHLPRMEDGRPFDFRWLVQYVDGPKIVARVARIGKVGAVTTNIHTGGSAVDATTLSEKDWPRGGSLIKQLDEVALTAARALEAKYGPYAELGIDLALRENALPVLFEVNPTPGRRMLRSLDGQVRQMSLQFLIEYAIRATGHGT